MSENTDIPGIDGLVSAITGEDPGTLFGYFTNLMQKFDLLTFSIGHLDKKFMSDLRILLHQKTKSWSKNLSKHRVMLF